jgi:hypothetical protein
MTLVTEKHIHLYWFTYSSNIGVHCDSFFAIITYIQCEHCNIVHGVFVSIGLTYNLWMPRLGFVTSFFLNAGLWRYFSLEHQLNCQSIITFSTSSSFSGAPELLILGCIQLSSGGRQLRTGTGQLLSSGGRQLMTGTGQLSSLEQPKISGE